MMKRMAMTAAALFVATSAMAQDVPEGYPDDYADLIETSKSEDGILIYGNLSEEFWAPVLELFGEKYPWIKVETLDMGGELWERYFAESNTGTRTADMILTGTIDRWIDFYDRGALADYTSPEAASLPDWSMPFPGLYTSSTDPVLISYNKAVLPEDKWPHSLADVAALVEDPDIDMSGKVTTYDAAASPFGLALYWTWVKGHDGDWSVIDTYGPASRPERSGGTMRSKVISGEYSTAIFLSGINMLYLERPEYKQIAGWAFPKDGTPVMMRGVGLTKAASSPASARLLLDLLLSKEGQIAFSRGGMTPYRDDVSADEAAYFTLDAIKKDVGEENVFIIEYDRDLIAKRDEFVSRWKTAFERN